MVSALSIAIAIVFTAKTFSSVEFVFFEFNNDSGFQSTSYTVMIGLLCSLFGLSGYDSGATLAEETQNAEIAAPKAIINSCIMSSITGLIFILSLLFACGGRVD